MDNKETINNIRKDQTIINGNILSVNGENLIVETDKDGIIIDNGTSIKITKQKQNKVNTTIDGKEIVFKRRTPRITPNILNIDKPSILRTLSGIAIRMTSEINEIYDNLDNSLNESQVADEKYEHNISRR